MSEERERESKFRIWEPKLLVRPTRGQWKRGIAVGQIASGRMRVLNGDDDVYTKSGRRTRVELEAKNIRLSNAGDYFLVDVSYSVKESQGDHTHLKWEGTALCGIPQDSRDGTVTTSDVAEFSRSWYVYGKEHDTLPVPVAVGTCIADGVYRIDGKGGDRYSAAVELSLEIPFNYFDQSP